MSNYCTVAPGHEFHGPYHDREYGFPIKNDDHLFERLILEINQAGLSWLTILKKRESFQRAYHSFEIARVARYGAKETARLLNDAGIIRNRLKVEAAIENAKRIQIIQKDSGSFRKWLDAHHPKSKDEWVKLFKTTFQFTGGEITNEFLMSTGYLPGAHHENCPVFAKIARTNPPWMKTSSLKAPKIGVSR
jgi:DNA-3-methyladenine glycosylase I